MIRQRIVEGCAVCIFTDFCRGVLLALFNNKKYQEFVAELIMKDSVIYVVIYSLAIFTTEALPLVWMYYLFVRVNKKREEHDDLAPILELLRNYETVNESGQ